MNLFDQWEPPHTDQDYEAEDSLPPPLSQHPAHFYPPLDPPWGGWAPPGVGEWQLSLCLQWIVWSCHGGSRGDWDRGALPTEREQIGCGLL